MNVSDLKTGDRLQQMRLLLVSAAEGKTGSGSPFITVMLGDRSGLIEGKYWDTRFDQTPILASAEPLKTVLLVDGLVGDYKGKPQLKVYCVGPCDDDPADYLPPVLQLEHLSDIEAAASGTLIRTPPVLIERATTRTPRSGGKPFLLLDIRDRSTPAGSPVSGVAEIELESLCVQGAVVHLTGTVEEYREEKQLRVQRAEPTDLQARDFLPRSLREPSEMFDELRAIAMSELCPPLRWVVTSTLDSFRETLMDAPAAQGVHRAWRGGLLEHTIKVVDTAILIGPAFYAAGVDPEILIAAAILHDLHKCQEYSVGAGFTVTIEGQLLGHIYLGARNAELLCDHYGVDPEVKLRLVHAILSHHGQPEWGAVKEPMTPEAIALHHCDVLVAQMEIAEEARGKVNADGRTEYLKPLKRGLFFGRPRPEPTEPDDIPFNDGPEPGVADPDLSALSGSNEVHSMHRPEHSEGMQSPNTANVLRSQARGDGDTDALETTEERLERVLVPETVDLFHGEG